jgi:hypothetical protein
VSENAWSNQRYVMAIVMSIIPSVRGSGELAETLAALLLGSIAADT